MDLFLDARGMQCPLPVIETKKLAMDAKPGDTIHVLVDNEVAVQNLMKFAAQKGYDADREERDDTAYGVIIKVKESDPESCCMPYEEPPQSLVVVSSDVMGDGQKELGKVLMKAFLFALTRQETAPATILFYNSGAFLTCEGSDSLEDLQELQSKGTEILTCGTCLNFYGLGEKLKIGSVTNMYDIVDRMMKAKKIIRP